MVKYYHELTKKEYSELVKKKLTWSQLEKLYPQPDWCNYYGATRGLFGCWSLVGHRVTDENFCMNCDARKSVKKK